MSIQLFEQAILNFHDQLRTKWTEGFEERDGTESDADPCRGCVKAEDFFSEFAAGTHRTIWDPGQRSFNVGLPDRIASAKYQVETVVAPDFHQYDTTLLVKAPTYPSPSHFGKYGLPDIGRKNAIGFDPKGQLVLYVYDPPTSICPRQITSSTDPEWYAYRKFNLDPNVVAQIPGIELLTVPII